MSTNVLSGWVKGSFTAAGITHDTYRKGAGPLVVVVHEVPGITPKVAAFAEEVVASGFTVVMPDLVGTPGKEMSNGYAMSSLAKVCVSKEFTAMASNKTSPIIGWLRALGRSLHQEVGGKGIGAVGMCFSGGFALGGIHPHVERAGLLEAEAPFGAVELRRGKAEIKEQPVDRAGFRGDLGKAAEVFPDKAEPVGSILAGKFFRLGLRVRIHVEGDHAGPPPQEGAGVAATTKGRVDHRASGGGLEHLHDRVEEDR
ncbi:MAG: hypothetical protein EBX95_11040, partial [Acidimicrobiia bacterium]|nr:hypothetical protein [Acidimicrobiia bacterium]